MESCRTERNWLCRELGTSILGSHSWCHDLQWGLRVWERLRKYKAWTDNVCVSWVWSTDRRQVTHVFSECNEKPLRSFREGLVFSFTPSKGYFLQQMALGREQRQAEPFPRDWLADHQGKEEYIGIPLLGPGLQVRYKEKSPLPWLAHSELSMKSQGLDAYGQIWLSHIRSPSQGRTLSSSIEWGELLVKLLWGDKVCRVKRRPAQHLERVFQHAFIHLERNPTLASTQAHIKSTFPSNCIHIFAIWCVLIFSKGPLLELFNCHRCKGQPVIFSADHFFWETPVQPSQSYNFISEHSWMIMLSKSGNYCRINGLPMRTERALDLVHLKIIYQAEGQ